MASYSSLHLDRAQPIQQNLLLKLALQRMFYIMYPLGESS